MSMPNEPPTMPEDLAEVQPVPGWPKVVGIISICWGGLGLVCGGCGALSLFIMPQLLAGQGDMGELPPTMKPGPALMGLMVVSLAVSVLLIVAGWLCVLRRAVARALHLVYAVAGLVSSVAMTAVQWQGMVEMERWVRENPESMFAKGYSPTGQLAGLLFGVVDGRGVAAVLPGVVRAGEADAGIVRAGAGAAAGVRRGGGGV
jgi:hypothetical protein